MFIFDIACDDRVVKTTANVKLLLRYMRTKERLRWLWVDAICRNQEDDTDRAQQAPRIDILFGRVKEVHVWLGEKKMEDNTPLHL